MINPQYSTESVALISSTTIPLRPLLRIKLSDSRNDGMARLGDEKDLGEGEEVVPMDVLPVFHFQATKPSVFVWYISWAWGAWVGWIRLVWRQHCSQSAGGA